MSDMETDLIAIVDNAPVKPKNANKRMRRKAIKSSQFACAKCGNNTYEPLGSIPTQEYGGTLRDGRAFTAIKRQRIRCTSCSQVDILVGYDFVTKETD